MTKSQNVQLLLAAEGLLRPLNPRVTVENLQKYLADLGRDATPVATANRLLRVMEFASLAGVGRTKVFSMVKRGQIRAIHLGRRSLRIPASELARLVGGVIR